MYSTELHLLLFFCGALFSSLHYASAPIVLALVLHTGCSHCGALRAYFRTALLRARLVVVAVSGERVPHRMHGWLQVSCCSYADASRRKITPSAKEREHTEGTHP